MREEYSDSKILQASKATGLTPKTIMGILEQADRGGASLRARSVLNHLLLNGSCTTSDLAEAGYNHPPRAVRDLKDAGVIVVTKMEKYQNPVSGKPSRRARYSIVGFEQSHGRRPLTRAFSDSVKQRGTCEACGSATNLQADHRVPFAIAGKVSPTCPQSSWHSAVRVIAKNRGLARQNVPIGPHVTPPCVEVVTGLTPHSIRTWRRRENSLSTP